MARGANMGTAVSGWRQQLVSRIGGLDHAPVLRVVLQIGLVPEGDSGGAFQALSLGVSLPFPGGFTAVHCLSLPVSAFHCLSLPVTAYQCISLPVTACQCISLPLPAVFLSALQRTAPCRSASPRSAGPSTARPRSAWNTRQTHTRNTDDTQTHARTTHIIPGAVCYRQ